MQMPQKAYAQRLVTNVWGNLDKTVDKYIAFPFLLEGTELWGCSLQNVTLIEPL